MPLGQGALLILGTVENVQGEEEVNVTLRIRHDLGDIDAALVQHFIQLFRIANRRVLATFALNCQFTRRLTWWHVEWRLCLWQGGVLGELAPLGRARIATAGEEPGRVID